MSNHTDKNSKYRWSGLIGFCHIIKQATREVGDSEPLHSAVPLIIIGALSMIQRMWAVRCGVIHIQGDCRRVWPIQEVRNSRSNKIYDVSLVMTQEVKQRLLHESMPQLHTPLSSWMGIGHSREDEKMRSTMEDSPKDSLA